MERCRSKRNYHYDGDSIGRSKPRYNNNYHHFNSGGGGGGSNNRYRGGGGGGNGRPSKSHPETMATTTYRVLCHDAKAGGVIGKSGSIIKSIRQHTGAWINVHELVPGDAERIIEISDNRRRDPDGRMPSFSPAQEALFSVHDRILESEPQFGYGGATVAEDEEDYGGVRAGGGRVVTRLVVSKLHVGCLLGKGGKIIEQMRIETKTHIRILPRETNLPRCVSLSEEIVQIVGEAAAVRNALAIVSSRLRESQHRDRSHFQGRVHSPERPFSPADDYIPQQRRQSSDRFHYRNNSFSSRQSSYAEEAPAVPVVDNVQPFYTEELVFRILCPVDKISKVVGESEGIVDLLQNEIGVDVRMSEPVSGSDEQIITIFSEEAPDDQLFPAQEALLHIQTQIVDLIPDKDNLITTRLLVSSRDSVCLEGKAGSVSEISRLTGASVQILVKEEVPRCVSISDDVVQITGEIRAARDALVELTLRLRSHMYKENSQKETPPASTSTTGPLEGVAGVIEVASSNNTTQSRQGLTIAPQYKDSGGSVAKAGESEHRDEVPNTASRMSVPLVTRSTLEVVLPDQVIPKLVTKSRNKLAQISEWSGVSVTLAEDRPGETQNVIRISGTPEQVERAQSLLQGFILSIQDDES